MEYIFIILLTVIAALVGAITYTLYKANKNEDKERMIQVSHEDTAMTKSSPKFLYYLKKVLYHIFGI